MSHELDIDPPEDTEHRARMARQVNLERHTHIHNGEAGVANKIVWGCAAIFGLTLIGIGIWNASKTTELAERLAAVESTLAFLVQERRKP